MKDFSLNKKASVRSMFDNIAFRYDFLNHFLSFGIDRCWRKTAIKIISGFHKDQMKILDVATGTGDLAIAAMKLNPRHITGIDISRKMLETGREKIRRKGLSDKIDLIECDSENICFEDSSFDVAMVAFGVRNFTDVVKGLAEMRRVIRNGGLILVLEFSKPVSFPFSQVYNFYFRSILPFIGRIFSKDRDVYRYLPDSVKLFPDNEIFINLLEESGFENIRQKRLTGGIVSVYTGVKL